MVTETAVKGEIFNIQRFSVQDGPGIRTVVFMKGCPLSCPWCSNPESQKSLFEVGHVDAICDQCGKCLNACEKKAITVAEKKGIKIDRAICDNCAECIKVCTKDALRLFGKTVTVQEVFDEVEKDNLYYRNSRGGVTASGGEPLHQPEFVSALFKRCQDSGMHTAIETTGFAGRAALDMVMQYTDLFLFDIKLLDPGSHMTVCGVPNASILRNAEYIIDKGISLIVRVPLIPGINDTDENTAALKDWVKRVNPNLTVHLLPYHRFGMSKYQMLDRPYRIVEIKPFEDERVEAICNYFTSNSINCEVIR